MEFNDPTEIQLVGTVNYERRPYGRHIGQTQEEEIAKDKRVRGSDEYWANMLSKWPGLDDVVSVDLYLRCLE